MTDREKASARNIPEETAGAQDSESTANNSDSRRQIAEQLRRRRAASERLEPLHCGCRDSWAHRRICVQNSADAALDPDSLESWRAAWAATDGLGIMPLAVCRELGVPFRWAAR